MAHAKSVTKSLYLTATGQHKKRHQVAVYEQQHRQDVDSKLFFAALVQRDFYLSITWPGHFVCCHGCLSGPLFIGLFVC